MRKALRISLWVIGGIVFLLLAVVVFINTRSGKNFVREQAVSFLRNKLKTEVQIGELNYHLPKLIELKNVLFKDQAGDTMLAANTLRVDIAMMKLLSNTVSIQQVELEGAYVNLYRKAPDTAFNFDYVIKAFTVPVDTTKVVDSTAGLVMNLDRLVLKNVRFRWNDQTGGTHMYYAVGDLRLTMKELDPEKMIYRGDKLFANNVYASIIQGKSMIPAPLDTGNMTPLNLQLSANELQLKNVHYVQQNTESKFFMDMKVGSLVGHPQEIDIPNQEIKIKDFTLDNSVINVRVAARSAELAEEVADTLIDSDPAPQVKWRVLADALNLNNVAFVLNNESEPRLRSGMDYAHMNIQDLYLDADNINYTTDTIEARINHLAASEQSGLRLYELRTNFSYHPQGGYLRDLYLQTSNTILQDYLEVKYPSLDAVASNPNMMQFETNFRNSIVGMKDVLIFAPQLAQQPFFRQHRNGQVRMEAKVNGTLDELNINQLYLAGLGTTEVNVSGKLFGLPDPNRMSYDLNIQKLQSSRSDIETLLPKAALEQVRLPDRFGVTGAIAGTATAYRPNLLILSTDGNARVRGNISMAGGTGNEVYDLNIATEKLNLGRILKQDTLLGVVTANVTAKGRSFDVNRMNTAIKGTIQSAGFNRYTYRDIKFDGKIAAKQAVVQLNSNDPNAHLDISGTADFRGKYPAFTADGTIDSLDLQALNFVPSELKFRGILRADIQEFNPDYPRGTLVIDDPTIVTNGKNYFLDSMYIVSRPSADSGNNILINGYAIRAHLWGHTPLTKIGDIIQYQVDKHYALDSTGKNGVAYRKRYSNLPAQYDLNLRAHLENNSIIQGFVPDLKSFDTVGIAGGITNERLFLDVTAPQVNYMNYNITDAKVSVNGNDDALTYTAAVDRFQQGSIEVWYAHATGQVKYNTITSDISIADRDSVKKFGLSASLQKDGADQVLQLYEGLMLNYKTWNVAEPNRIVFGRNGFYVQNFGINNGPESISVNSQSATYNAPLTADISNFLLSNITNILTADTLLANGVLGGNINLQRFNPNPEITSVLGITNLSVMGDTIGNVDINVKSATQNAVDATVGITGHGNNINLNGVYYPTAVNGNNFNMQLMLDPLNVAAFEGVTMNQIKNTSGYIRGDLRVNGTLTSPLLYGTLRTDSLSTNIAMLNTQFRMPNEQIRFNGQTVLFDKFGILDSSGNRAELDGSLLVKNFTDINANMRLRANNWQAMNSTAQNNKDFYGRLFITTNMFVHGPLTAPGIDGSLNILKNTAMTVTIPTTQATVQEREGIVEFVDFSNPNRYLPLAVKNDTVRKLGQFAPGSEINLNVSTDEEAEFTVIIDEGAGDFVKIRGKADVNTSVAPDGALALTGSYEIVDGSYHLNYNFIRRQFNIQKGSRITFMGEPTDAELNVTAVYEANVPPYDLVSRQVTDPEELVYFKQRLPFEVRMILTGDIMMPTISFDIVLPEEKNYRVGGDVADVVQARLNQLKQNQSDLYRQVFSLIVLNRFTTENIFESGVGGGGVENIARQSASRFISEQLNQFAGGLIEGLDLTLDLTTSEDYTTGERRNRTDLSIGASKRLLNDRLTFSVGNNFRREGPRTNSTPGTSFIPGNLAVDYDLSASRTYRVRFFRRNEDLGAYQGYVTETGASFILQKDYNRFRQVFMSKKKRDRLRKERQQRRLEQQQKEEQPKEQNTQTGSTVLWISKDEEDKH